MRKALLAAACAVALFSAPAHAIVVAWTGVGTNDTIDWDQLGGGLFDVPSGTVVVSNGGLNATISDTIGTNSDLLKRVQDVSSSGAFAPGEVLLNSGIKELHDPSEPGSILVSFASPVRAAGAQIQSSSFGPFTARITTNDGSFFEIAGVSAFTSADTNPFLGVLSDSADISSILFTISVNPGDSGLTISQLDLITGVDGAIPEPATWAMMIAGFGLVGGAMRASRRKASWLAAA